MAAHRAAAGNTIGQALEAAVAASLVVAEAEAAEELLRHWEQPSPPHIENLKFNLRTA